MKIPEKINILGFVYEIILQNSIDDNLIIGNAACDGAIHYTKRKIYILKNDKIGDEHILQVLCHEITHAIEYHFDAKCEHTNMTEWQTDMIGTGLASIILNNGSIFNG